MSKIKIRVLLIIFLITAFFGLSRHSLERGSGWIGGPVDYSYYFGETYSWERGYDSLDGFWKGSFPETKCGILYIDTFEYKTRKPEESNKYVSSDKCKNFLSLTEFVDRYSNEITVGELRLKRKMLSEEKQVAMFNGWKDQGLLNDVRYKDVTVYDWDNIWDFLYRVLLIPTIITFVAWLLLRLKFKDRDPRISY